MDIISACGIKNILQNELKNRINIDVRNTCPSTNSEVRALAQNGGDEGSVVVSASQSQGRGRLGRSFFSPDSTGVYMSILLRPTCHPQDAVLITTAAAVAVCEALELCGVSGAQIKWVNDIFLNGKKVCGILTESGFAADGSKLEYAVVGVGINVYAPQNGFPDDIKDIAGAVFSQEQQGLKNEFVACFLNSFFKYYDKLSLREHIGAYREKCFVLGKEINIISGDGITSATALDVDENCNLLVELRNGEKLCVGTGEISLRIRN